ncbi:MAG: hypothetical protein KAJ29_06440 [Alphaproteobacteria bacterium]|nr:hypothetical protein [Alphaproteobacteria bacterium]
MGINFNEISKDTSKKSGGKGRRYGEDSLKESIRTGERTRFVHKPNPMVERDYQIFEYDYKKGEYNHVGDYVLVNKDEPRKITEKKVKNLMSIINKKDDLIDLSNLTKTRVLYTIVPEAQAGDQTKMIFKDHDGSGVSKDNAIFTMRKGVLYDKYGA